MDVVEGVGNNQQKRDRKNAENRNQRENSPECSKGYRLWEYTPDSILLSIFQYLTAKELIIAGEVCKSWNRISRDELLWKDLLYRTYMIDPKVDIVPGKTSWLGEFKRLTYHTPILETEILKDHSHQVLHVSFSHNGKMFATCSKDGYVLVWNSDYPVSVKYYHDMKTFSWKYTQFSQFNDSDTLLLVSGVHFGTPQTTSGEIAVFRLSSDFDLQCRIVNKPYDIFGTWYSDHYLLSGNLYWLAHLVSTSFLWLNKASQESTSEHIPIMTQLFRFYNSSCSSVRSIMVAKCLAPETDEQDLRNSSPSSSKEERRSHSHSKLFSTASNVDSENLRQPVLSSRTSSRAHRVEYNQEAEEKKMGRRDNSNDRKSEAQDWEDENESEESSASEESEVEEAGETAENPDKYLIFTTGSKTYTPHQLGFKRIKNFTFPTRLDPGPSLRERLEQRERERENPDAAVNTDWLDYESVADKFDKIDHLIDLHGHIIGMGLSPDHRYLYVNTRPWPTGYIITNPLHPPPIAQEIDIHVIDLITLKQVGTLSRAHKAYTPDNECFFIYLDVCNEYVASGAEDRHGYLWDRHYGVCVAKFPHCDVVNSVAFNPRNPEMLVTTSDDYTIKVWRSKAMARSLGLDATSYRKGMVIKRRPKFKKNSCDID